VERLALQLQLEWNAGMKESLLLLEEEGRRF